MLTQTAEIPQTPPAMRRTKVPDRRAYERTMYKSVERMLSSAAYTASRNSGLSFDDLRSQADLLFVHAVRTFDGGRDVKFSTYVHTVVHNGLIDYGRTLQKHVDYSTRVFATVDADGLEHDPIDTYEDVVSTKQYALVEFLASLTADESELVDIVLSGFSSSIEHLRTMAINRLGFDAEQFSEAVDGIKIMIRSI